MDPFYQGYWSVFNANKSTSSSNKQLLSGLLGFAQSKFAYYFSPNLSSPNAVFAQRTLGELLHWANLDWANLDWVKPSSIVIISSVLFSWCSDLLKFNDIDHGTKDYINGLGLKGHFLFIDVVCKGPKT